MIDREEISTERILGKQVLQVCHNLRNPISQIYTASSIGLQLAQGNEELTKMFQIMLNASRLFAETINAVEKRTTLEEKVVHERFDIISFIKQQILFYDFDERMRYKTKCHHLHEREEVFVLAVPADMFLIISNIMYFLLSRVENADRSDLEITSHELHSILHIGFYQTCVWKKNAAMSEESPEKLIRDLIPFLFANNSQLKIISENDRSVKVILEIPLAS